MSWPFETWSRVAVKRFGLPPSEFWDMPLRDWLVLMKETARPTLDRTRLNDLIKNYPDEGGGDGPPK